MCTVYEHNILQVGKMLRKLKNNFTELKDEVYADKIKYLIFLRIKFSGSAVLRFGVYIHTNKPCTYVFTIYNSSYDCITI